MKLNELGRVTFGAVGEACNYLITCSWLNLSEGTCAPWLGLCQENTDTSQKTRAASNCCSRCTVMWGLSSAMIAPCLTTSTLRGRG